MAFDLDLAIERLAPGAEYLPNTGRTAIAQWRDNRPQPTSAQLQAASDAALAAIAAANQVSETERAQLRATYVALRDGTGTAAERFQRLERTVAWLMRKEKLS